MTRRDATTNSDHGTPGYETMQRAIRDRRSRIGGTLDSLRHRLSPHTIKEQTMNRMTNRMSSGASSMGDMVRGNPVPLAMIGIGVGWMLLSRSGLDQRIAHSGAMRNVRSTAGSTARYARDTFYSAADRVRDAAGDLYDRAGDMASDAYDQASEAAGRMTGGGGTYDGRSGGPAGRGGSYPGGRGPAGESSGRSMTSSMSRQLGNVTTSFWDLVEDHPLVAGVMGVALGAALGASIPSTHTEERWVGDYAGQVTGKAKEVAQDVIERGTRAAQAAAEAAREHVPEAVDDAKGAAKEQIDRPT